MSQSQSLMTPSQPQVTTFVGQPLTAYADRVVGLESGCRSSIPILSVYRLHHPMPHIWNKTETRQSNAVLYQGRKELTFRREKNQSGKHIMQPGGEKRVNIESQDLVLRRKDIFMQAWINPEGS